VLGVVSVNEVYSTFADDLSASIYYGRLAVDFGIQGWMMSKVAETIEEQIKKQQAKLAELKARKQAIEARAKAAESKKNRADDTRKKILVGAAVLAQIENNPEGQERTKQMLDKFLTKESDRKLFGL
jgi:hypothetical protein